MDGSTFHKSNYNKMKAEQEYAAAILRELPRVNRARNFEELKESIYKILQLLGKCVGADRVYLFDRSKDGQGVYSERYEWCAPGIDSMAEEGMQLPAEEIPVWDMLLKKGEAFSIGDIEEVRLEMPKEYERMKRQEISSMLAAPVYNQNRLSGFIGVDNPYTGVSQLFMQQLTFAGAHLNTARENLRLLMLQKQSLLKTEREKEILHVLCEDSTSVFKVNLPENKAEIIKMDTRTNASRIIEPKIDTTVCYYDEMKSFYSHFIVPESAPDFLEIFEPHRLMQLFKEKKIVSRKFRTVPNAMGQIYFEVRAIKMDKVRDAGYMLLDFRNIDEIVAEEKNQQEKLEVALKEAETKNDIISAISKIYFAIYRINLRTGQYEEISKNIARNRAIGKTGSTFCNLKDVNMQNIDERYQKYALQFFHFDSLKMRLRTEDSVAAEYMVKDGNWHLARFIVQERDENGELVQVLLAIRSISEEKRREKNLIAAADDANQANEAKSDFLSRMSHDIRTPMNAIMGFTDIAQKNREDPQKVKDCLDKIEQSGEHLQQLVNDILDISRIESGEFKITRQPVDICKVFDTALEGISGIASQKGVLLSGKKHDISRKILITDPLRLSQIYTNLLSNAVKYTMKEGRVSFEMYEETMQNQTQMRLISIVKDTGIGMSEEFMKQMYMKFARAVDTRVNEVRGSGLGLSIVKQIVDLMDGKIEVKSAVGAGTTFKIILELPIAENQEAEKEAENEEKQIVLPDRQIRILVAEDNELNYEILEEQLKPYGIKCIRSENGKDAVQKFRYSVPGEYDAILMDMQMPIMSGPEATEAIRKMDHPDARKIPIIALTANAYRRDVRKCMDAGMNEHLAKPVKIETLLHTLSNYLTEK